MPLLQFATSELAEVAVPDFDPVRHFGGWGSSVGALVRTRRGKRYLIGTDEPDRLAAALNAVRESRVRPDPRQ